MATFKTTHGGKETALLDTFVGRYVRIIRRLENAYGFVEPGTVLRIDGWSNKGLQLKSNPCPHCAIGFFISGVSRVDVQLIPKEST